MSTLFQAALHGNQTVVQSSIDAGVNLDLRGNNNVTVLMNAALKGHENIVQSLIDAGVKLDLKNNWGITALVSAALQHHESAVQMFLEHGASLPTEFQWTAIANAQNMLPAYVKATKQLIHKNHAIIHERARAAGEYFESEGMPPDVIRLIQQIGVEDLPPERARPVPEEKQEEQ